MSARILVVEDEEALTTLLRYNLDAEGYDVETEGRGSREGRCRALGRSDGSWTDRIPAAGVFSGAPGPGVQPRAIARQRLGPRYLYRRTHRGCAYRAVAQIAQPGPRAGSDPHRARCRLRARRPLRESGGVILNRHPSQARAGV